MIMTTWMRRAALALIFATVAQAQTPIPQTAVPKELEGWLSWVQYGQEFRRCPHFANTDGSRASYRVCAWPGRLNLEIIPGGGRFAQTWVGYSDAWIPLPGSVEHWPTAVTVNGTAAAVVARDGIPQIRITDGTYTIAGRFTWTKRPESLPVPAQTALVTLSLDGHRAEQVDRPDGAVWLGKRPEGEAAPQLDVQVYRLLSDGSPMRLTTRLNLQVAGDAREAAVPNVFPKDFQPMSLDSELPARLDANGQLRVQVRAGSWTITVTERAADDLRTIAIPIAQGQVPKQEVWSYASDDRLRVAALEGAEGIDPAQANVPQEWRGYPSYRVAAGSTLRIVERSRGVSPQEGNHFNLQRELYLDFAHRGYTVIDRLSGQMRSGWRLDMRAPFRLMRAASGADDLLVTEAGEKMLTGVELRNPEVNLSTVARIAVAGGVMPANGWTERFDHVAGVLNLPPGHRLLAAFGVDSAPGAWVERWGLLDMFLLLIATVLSLRLFGWFYAAVTFSAVALLHQDEAGLVWLLLLVFLTIVLGKSLPSGSLRSALAWSRNLFLGVLLLVSVPLAVTQLRFALYPQLADPGQYTVHQDGLAPANEPKRGGSLEGRMYAPNAVTSAAAPSPALEEAVVTAAKDAAAPMFKVSSQAQQRYAPGTLVQTGPGVPHWHYAAYPFSWSGPVDAAQSVHFIIMPPWLVGVWRVLSIVLLAALFARLTRGNLDIKAEWRRFRAARGAAAASLLIAAFACTVLSARSHATNTPDPALLNDLKNRISQPPKCAPSCAEIMAAHLSLTPGALEATLDVAALSSVALALPTTGQRFDPDSISVDATPVPGVYRDADQQIWIALKPGAHSVKISARLPPSDSIQLLFPQVPREIAVSGDGWDVSGVNGVRLLGNTLELVRRRTAGHETDAVQGSVQFPPFVRIRRAFTLDLDWSLDTTIERLAPEKGGFTLEIPMLAGESVLTPGIETKNGTDVLAGFESGTREFRWHSALAQADTLTLVAGSERPWSEVWLFRVSPMWRVEFSGVPAVIPEEVRSEEWTFEYFPRGGETLSLKISRPPPAPGGTLAIDNADLQLDVGKRSTNGMLQLSYRSTQGGRHSLGLPETARVTAVMLDGQTVPVRPEKGELSLALLPGAHHVQVNWQSSEGAALRIRVPNIDLNVASSNVSTVMRLPDDRWLLYAAGRGVGPAILYWGELIVFIGVAIALGRSRYSPLHRHEWLLLGLGLSTFSWSALLLFASWMFTMHWREGFAVAQLSRRTFNLLQAALILLSLAAVVSLVAAIPYGLLGNPDMRIAGAGQGAHELSWFNDQASGTLPTAWVLSISGWWYKTAMLLWALWLAFALARWLPMAWHALGQGGFWRKDAMTPRRAAAE